MNKVIKKTASLALSLLFAASSVFFIYQGTNCILASDPASNATLETKCNTEIPPAKQAADEINVIFTENAGFIQNPIFGKSVYSDGDSVAAGDGSEHYAYSEFIRDNNSMSLVNLAKGGTTFAYRQGRNDSICERIENMQGDYSYILFEGGYNDVFRGLPLGSVSDGKNPSDFDLFTMCGALEKICFEMKSKYPNTKKLFVLGHRLNDKYQARQEQAWKLIVKILDKWEIPYVDITAETGFDSDCYEADNQIFANDDGVHPTQYAYDKYYVPPIESKLKQL